MSVALPLSGTWRRVIRRRLEVVEPSAEPAGAAEHRAEFMVEMATRAQEAAVVAHREARAARMRAGKEFRFAALSDEGGFGATFPLEQTEAPSLTDPVAIVMAAMRADEEARWRLCDRAKAEADGARQRAEEATVAARIAQQAATEAQEVARVARLSLENESWPVDSYDVDAAVFVEQHRQVEAA